MNQLLNNTGWTARVTKLSRRSFLILLFLLILIPTSNFNLFNGLPFSSLPELIVVVLLVPLLFSASLRRLFSGFLFERHQRLGPLLTSMVAAGLLLKLIILTASVYTGFLACYKSPLAVPVSGSCEKSYENSFQRFGMTRVDGELDFLPDMWGLSFVNSKRFNFYAWEEGNILRDRLPFEVTWSTVLNRKLPGGVSIEYSGEGEVLVGDKSVVLLPIYESTRKVELAIPEGVTELQIVYRFDDGYRVSGAPPPGPGPVFQARFPDAGSSFRSLIAFGSVSAGWLVAGWLVDTIIVSSIAILVFVYLGIIRRELILLALVSALAFAIYYWMPEFGPLTRERGMLLCLGALLIALVIRPRRSRLLTAFFGVFLIVVLRSLLFQQDLSFVSVRPGGTDPLTYESQARTILDTFSLQGGEDIFFGQIFFRYFLFGSHFFFGDADAFVAIPALTALNFAIFYVVYRWLPSGSDGRRLARFAILLGGLLALTLVNTWHLVWMVHYGASEYPTWIFTLIAIPLLLSKKQTEWIIGAFLLGLTWITRTNQAIGILFILAAHVAWLRKLGRGKAVWASFAVFLIVAFLPGLHNAYFGGQFIPAPTYWDNRTNMILPPDLLARFFIELEVRLLVLRQLLGLLVVHDDSQRYLGTIVAMRALLIAWLAALIYAVTRWRRIATHVWLLLLMPLGYFAVQFFYNPYGDLFPRHFVIAYLAMGFVGMYLIHHLSTAQTPDG